MMALSDS